MDSVQKISIVNLLSAFSRALVFPFYILDWKNKEILYATGNPYFIGEYTADDLKSGGGWICCSGYAGRKRAAFYVRYLWKQPPFFRGWKMKTSRITWLRTITAYG